MGYADPVFEGRDMSQECNEQPKQVEVSGETSWGPKLFWAALLAILGFFYWLVIYSGGVVVHHG